MSIRFGVRITNIPLSPVETRDAGKVPVTTLFSLRDHIQSSPVLGNMACNLILTGSCQDMRCDIDLPNLPNGSHPPNVETAIELIKTMLLIRGVTIQDSQIVD